MNTSSPSVVDILKDPSTYRKAWRGAIVPLALGLIAFYVPDNHLSVAEVLSVIGASLATGGTVFVSDNKPVDSVE